jgi:hypothetical protein
VDADSLKEWIITISAAVTMLSVAVGIWLSLREYRLKLQAETRLAYSTQVDIDVKLLDQFSNLMELAHARSGNQVSETAVKAIIDAMPMDEVIGDKYKFRDWLDGAVITLPVGVAAQDAAIAAIFVLANRHEVLKPVAIQALESVSSFKSQPTSAYLAKLKKDS